MMPIYPLPTERARGFTLMEMLVVLAIVSLLAAIIAPGIWKKPAGLIREDQMTRMLDACAQAKAAARQNGAIMSIDPGTLISGSHFAPILGEKAGGFIRFAPDGSSNGGVLSVDGKAVLQVDWMTGGISRVH
jgi:prepilin-type N-terminal cleavage/methylation domain-containing protein